jgi:hypothetical protein
LTPEQREERITSHQDIIVMGDADKNFYHKIIIGDGTWCLACDPETKQQSSEWVGETSCRLKKLKFKKSRIKTMLIIFSTLRHRAQRIHTRGKNSKYRTL